ncbi:MAG TPA: antibiotic biosynthesis monooxygenase [Trebonia sp.]|jgi:heme-degrading monooxygenase HmoA
MSILLVTLNVRPGEEGRLVKVFSGTFRPAVSGQPGFRNVALLRPAAAGQPWLLDIRFATEPDRLTWVDTPLHQEVWPQVESLCERAEPVLYEYADQA